MKKNTIKIQNENVKEKIRENDKNKGINEILLNLHLIKIRMEIA